MSWPKTKTSDRHNINTDNVLVYHCPPGKNEFLVWYFQVRLLLKKLYFGPVNTTARLMAAINTFIANSKSGQSFRFIQTAKSTNGLLLEIESIFSPHSKEPPAHYHPAQTEDFTIVKGELTVKINSQLTVLKEGDSLHIPPGQVHSMWNRSEIPAIVNWKTRPAMDAEYLFETITGLANDGKTDNNGRPGILQLALTISRFSGSFRLAKPPFIIQRAVFYSLMPFAYLLGRRATYKKYLT